MRSLANLSDEIIVMIIYHLDDPTQFSKTSKRHYLITKDPYVRSSYFLYRYGRHYAFYYALSRGKLMNARVLEILSTSGAHFSRYLLQVAIHHYFRTTSHFIKSPWVRNLPLGVFTHFMSLGSRYGMDIPLAKGEDDGSLFTGWLKEKTTPGLGKKVDVQVIKDLFQKYGFMMFAPKDPIATQLPLAFALEPTLVPLALENGFHLDPQYRDYIFRKIFEKHPDCHNYIERAADIIQNVRAMTNVSKKMFLSRTVAAEICMECRSNVPAYVALKKLEASGELLFRLKDLVNDLLKLFLRTRSIIHPPTIPTLQQLYRDFASTFPSSTPRLVMLITVFCTAPTTGIFHEDISERPLYSLPEIFKNKLEHLGIMFVKRKDLLDVLVSPWCDRFQPILLFAVEQLHMDERQIYSLLEEAAIKSLGVSCKGKLIKRITEYHPQIKDNIAKAVEDHQIEVEDLPDWVDSNVDTFSTSLNTGLCSSELFQVYIGQMPDQQHADLESDDDGLGEEQEDEIDEEDDEENEVDAVHVRRIDERITKKELGLITQDTLSLRINIDSETAGRGRRRVWQARFMANPDSQLRLPYPFESLAIGRWILDTYGHRHPVTAIFMDHAIANNNHSILKVYVGEDVPRHSRVPITLKHFQIMARLGIDPFWPIWHHLEEDEFYATAEDYLDRDRESTVAGPSSHKSPAKMESGTPEFEHILSAFLNKFDNARKRPKRRATMSASYADPDSDDEDVQTSPSSTSSKPVSKSKPESKPESALQKWIKALSGVLKAEERKYKDKKKRIERDEHGKPVSRLHKTEFMRALITRLPDLRVTERLNKVKYRGRVIDIDCDCDADSGTDDEYRPAGHKRRRTDKIDYSFDSIE